MPAERSSICPPPAVILAGGLARRMGGGDKGLRLLGGRPILDRVIDRLAPQVGALALNANGDPSRLAGYGLPVLPDPVPARLARWRASWQRWTGRRGRGRRRW